MFSKPIRQNKINDLNEPVLNYKEYYKNNIILKKYKLPELKSIIKKYKLLINTGDKNDLVIIELKNLLVITGKKHELINRIETLFSKMKNAEIIQKRFRGWIVRYSFILNGEIINNRSLCVNDSDFVTLEPLDEIPRELFYSYKDAKNFYYGFNITSLIQMMKTKGKLTNPYNREGFDKKTLNNMISLYNIIQLIYPEHRDNTNKVKLTVCCNNNANILRNLDNNPSHRNISQRLMERYNNQDGPHDFAFLHRIISNQPRRLTMNDIENAVNLNNNTIQTANSNPLSIRYYEPRVFNQSILSNNILRDNYNKIIEMRRKPIETRIQELFMEIDQLGNYTQSAWFSNLQRHEYIVLYRNLYDIWSFRGQLSNEIKNNICPLFDPFTEIFTQPIYQNQILEEQIKSACLTIIENLVYSGIDEDHRKIGTLHALTALTLVSRNARNAMPWLYESVAF
jgi:hypothetical protein